MELLWTIAIWIYTYRIMVTFYGDLSTLTTPHWTLSVSSASNAIIGALVQVNAFHSISGIGTLTPVGILRKSCQDLVWEPNPTSRGTHRGIDAGNGHISDYWTFSPPLYRRARQKVRLDLNTCHRGWPS